MYSKKRQPPPWEVDDGSEHLPPSPSESEVEVSLTPEEMEEGIFFNRPSSRRSQFRRQDESVEAFNPLTLPTLPTPSYSPDFSSRFRPPREPKGTLEEVLGRLESSAAKIALSQPDDAPPPHPWNPPVLPGRFRSEPKPKPREMSHLRNYHRKIVPPNEKDWWNK